MSTFLDLYSTDLSTELGSTDTIRFTTVLRKRAVNEGARVFNEQTSCFVKRFPIVLSDTVAEYDLESTSVITAADYLWPSKTTASLKRVDASTNVSYVEGPGLPFKSEEELNQTRSGWRAESAGVPDCWTMRDDGGSSYAVLVPAPSVPSGETWTLLWPYVAQPADMTGDSEEPYSVSGNARTTLRPYHRGILYYAAAQIEKLRKNTEGVDRQMKMFAAIVSKYFSDQQPKRGSSIRLAVNYRARRQGVRVVCR